MTGRTGELDWSDLNRTAETAMVLIHSLGTDRSMWDDQIDVLASTRRVIAIDLPGHGRSTAGTGPYTLSELGDDVLEMTKVCGVDEFEVLGISIGGLIALWLAINAPDRLSTLVACNTAARLGSAELWSDRIEAVRGGGMEAVRESVVPRFFAPDFDLIQPGASLRFNDIFAATDPVGYVGCCAALRDADLSDEVGLISSRTLLVGGEHDVATPPQQSRWLHQQIPGSRLEIIPGAGHLSNIDQPEAFERVLTDFISAHHR